MNEIVNSFEIVRYRLANVQTLQRYIGWKPFFRRILFSGHVEAVEPSRGQLALDVYEPNAADTSTLAAFVPRVWCVPSACADVCYLIV